MKKVAMIGTGPAGLMAAWVLSEQPGCSVTVFEKNKAPGRKLLVAGSSGLNIGNSLSLEEFASHYRGAEIDWRKLLTEFPSQDWLGFIHQLGFETFEGTSGRYFVREMKASRLLRAWVDALTKRGVRFVYDAECVGFETSERISEASVVRISHPDGSSPTDYAPSCKIFSQSGPHPDPFDAVVFALGGGSWVPQEKPLRWPQLFIDRGISFTPFEPSNAGFQVRWKPGFLTEADGWPLKNIEFISSRGRRKGDAVITQYGIEGTPIYFCGAAETCFVDLKPDLSEAQIIDRLNSVRENLSPMRRVKKVLKLSDAALALLFHEAPSDSLKTIEAIAKVIKKFPLSLVAPQSLDESISSSGGVALSEIDPTFMLKKFPGVYAVGEMLDWDAPTGGFLIQACVSQGVRAARAILAKN